MPTNDKIRSLVDQIPDPDKGGSYANLDMDKVEQIKRIVAQLHSGGRDSVLGLIDMLEASGRDNSSRGVKAHFALHLLAVHVTQRKSAQAREEFARTVASQVGGDRPKAIQIYLIEQLQLAGTGAIVGTLGRVLLDPELCDAAARALAAIRDGAAEQLLAVLPEVQGRQRLSIINSLAVLRAGQAAGAFRGALEDGDPDIRIAAAWGIARIADASAAEALLRCAEAHDGWERINQTDACLALAEGLFAAGKKRNAATIYGHLQKTRTDQSQRHIREAAEKALAPAPVFRQEDAGVK